MSPDGMQIKLLCELESLCYPETIAYDYATMNYFLQNPGTLLLCEWRRGVLVGFQLNDRARGTIITIDVHPDYRRQGIARTLMRQSLAILKGAGLRRVTSQVATDNEASIMLHLKFGFKIRHRIPHYYENGQDAYLLTRKLSSKISR